MITPEAMSPAYTRGTTCFAQTIWGNQVEVPRNSQILMSTINLGQSSQDSENLSKDAKKQSGACTQVNLNLFPTNMGHCLEPMITRGISPIVYILQSPREANLSKVPTNWGKSMQVQFDILTNTQ